MIGISKGKREVYTGGNKQEQTESLQTLVKDLERHFEQVKDEDDNKEGPCGVPLGVYKRLWAKKLKKKKRQLGRLEKQLRN
jgi:hypothetical protein